MNSERDKTLTYKPYLFGFTATSLGISIALGVGNLAWLVIFKLPNPLLVDAFYISLGISTGGSTIYGIDKGIENYS